MDLSENAAIGKRMIATLFLLNFSSLVFGSEFRDDSIEENDKLYVCDIVVAEPNDSEPNIGSIEVGAPNGTVALNRLYKQIRYSEEILECGVDRLNLPVTKISSGNQYKVLAKEICCSTKSESHCISRKEQSSIKEAGFIPYFNRRKRQNELSHRPLGPITDRAANILDIDPFACTNQEGPIVIDY